MRTVALIALLALFALCGVMLWLTRPRQPAPAPQPGSYEWLWEQLKQTERRDA